MSELSFEQMFEESSFKRLRTGEAVTGQVIGVKEDEIILSIAGSKSEGIITSFHSFLKSVIAPPPPALKTPLRSADPPLLPGTPKGRQVRLGKAPQIRPDGHEHRAAPV